MKLFFPVLKSAYFAFCIFSLFQLISVSWCEIDVKLMRNKTAIQMIWNRIHNSHLFDYFGREDNVIKLLPKPYPSSQVDGRIYSAARGATIIGWNGNGRNRKLVDTRKQRNYLNIKFHKNGSNGIWYNKAQQRCHSITKCIVGRWTVHKQWNESVYV